MRRFYLFLHFFFFRASRCCRSLHRILHLFRRPDLCMSGDHAACGAFPCSAVHRNALFLLKALQHALSRSFIKISEKRPRLFLYALPELLPALFFILALHLFPFAHDIFDVHLTGDLLFHRPSYS